MIYQSYWKSMEVFTLLLMQIAEFFVVEIGTSDASISAAVSLRPGPVFCCGHETQ